MHVDDVSQTSQLMDRFQSAVALESGLDCYKKEDRYAEENDIVDAGVSELIQLIQISQASRPGYGYHQNSDEHDHESDRDSHWNPDQVVRLPEINRRLRYFFPDDDQLIGDLAQAGTWESLGDSGFKALQRAQDVRFVELSIGHGWNLPKTEASRIDAHPSLYERTYSRTEQSSA